MASDKRQVERMEDHRANLLIEGKVSYPPESGTAAIFMTHGPDPNAGDGPDAYVYDVLEGTPEVMDGEAQRIQRYLRWRGKKTAYFPNADIADFRTVLDDESVSDLIVIGNGSLSGVRISPWARENGGGGKKSIVNFYDVISRDGRNPTIKHLKSGSFYQRSCGMMTGPLNIPFPWGFMADRARIWASPQLALCPNPWHVRPASGLVNLAARLELEPDAVRGPMSYAQAQALFGPRPPMTARRYSVPKILHPAYDWLRQNPVASAASHGVTQGLWRVLGH